jgi:hypothetical protein
MVSLEDGVVVVGVAGGWCWASVDLTEIDGLRRDGCQGLSSPARKETKSEILL